MALLAQGSQVPILVRTGRLDVIHLVGRVAALGAGEVVPDQDTLPDGLPVPWEALATVRA